MNEYMMQCKLLQDRFLVISQDQFFETIGPINSWNNRMLWMVYNSTSI